MDAAQLSRWTRFAAKGGIGKCTALADCVAQSPDDLMFLSGDEITVLMRLDDEPDKFLGYCEGVVGRFDGARVRFHGRLKTPIRTKRSSSTSQSHRASATASLRAPSRDSLLSFAAASAAPTPLPSTSLPGSPHPHTGSPHAGTPSPGSPPPGTSFASTSASASTSTLAASSSSRSSISANGLGIRDSQKRGGVGHEPDARPDPGAGAFNGASTPHSGATTPRAPPTNGLRTPPSGASASTDGPSSPSAHGPSAHLHDAHPLVNGGGSPPRVSPNGSLAHASPNGISTPHPPNGASPSHPEPNGISPPHAAPPGDMVTPHSPPPAGTRGAPSPTPTTSDASVYSTDEVRRSVDDRPRRSGDGPRQEEEVVDMDGGRVLGDARSQLYGEDRRLEDEPRTLHNEPRLLLDEPRSPYDAQRSLYDTQRSLADALREHDHARRDVGHLGAHSRDLADAGPSDRERIAAVIRGFDDPRARDSRLDFGPSSARHSHLDLASVRDSASVRASHLDLDLAARLELELARARDSRLDLASVRDSRLDPDMVRAYPLGVRDTLLGDGARDTLLSTRGGALDVSALVSTLRGSVFDPRDSAFGHERDSTFGPRDSIATIADPRARDSVATIEDTRTRDSAATHDAAPVAAADAPHNGEASNSDNTPAPTSPSLASPAAVPSSATASSLASSSFLTSSSLASSSSFNEATRPLSTLSTDGDGDGDGDGGTTGIGLSLLQNFLGGSDSDSDSLSSGSESVSDDGTDAATATGHAHRRARSSFDTAVDGFPVPPTDIPRSPPAALSSPRTSGWSPPAPWSQTGSFGGQKSPTGSFGAQSPTGTFGAQSPTSVFGSAPLTLGSAPASFGAVGTDLKASPPLAPRSPPASFVLASPPGSARAASFQSSAAASLHSAPPLTRHAGTFGSVSTLADARSHADSESGRERADSVMSSALGSLRERPDSTTSRSTASVFGDSMQAPADDPLQLARERGDSDARAPSDTASELDYGVDWEGASDIYDNYRYSRASMMSKASVSSRRVSAVSRRQRGDGTPPPVPTGIDGRPSFERGVSFERGMQDDAASVYSLPSPEHSRTTFAPPTLSPTRPLFLNKDRARPAPIDVGSSPPADASRLSDSNSHTGLSPLLHTTFASPESSPARTPMALDTPHGAEHMPTPMSPNMPGPSSSSGSGGALRQRVDVERQASTGLSIASVSSSAVVEHTDNGDDDAQSPSSSRGHGVTARDVGPLAATLNKSKEAMLDSPLIVVNPAPAPPPYEPAHTLPAGSRPNSAIASEARFNDMPVPVIVPAAPPLAPVAGPSPSADDVPPARPRPRPRAAAGATANAHDPATRQSLFGSARTSVFLPHPNAPKPAPAPPGPMYGRAPLPPALAAPASVSVVHTMRLAAAGRGGFGGGRRLATFYGMCEPELADALGPVPILWSLEPPNDVPANRMRRMASAEAGFTQLPRVGSPASGLRAGAGSPAAGEAAQAGAIPRPNFFPHAGGARPRSRSFSGFESPFPVPKRASKGGDDATARPSQPSRTSSDGALPPSGQTPAPQASNGSGPANGRGPAVRRQYTPSPLALQRAVTASPGPNTPPPPSNRIGAPSCSSSPERQPSSPSLDCQTISPPSSRQMSPSSSPPTAPDMLGPGTPSSLQQRFATPDIQTPGTPSSIQQRFATPDLQTPGTPSSIQQRFATPDLQSDSEHSTRKGRGLTIEVPPLNAPSSPPAVEENAGVNTAASTATFDTAQQSPTSTRRPLRRLSGETEGSHYSDARSVMSSPPPTASPHRRSSSLRSKLSFSALRSPRSATRDDAGVVSPSPETQTVQVQDTDFELVLPSPQPLSTGRPSVESSPVLPLPSLTESSLLRAGSSSPGGASSSRSSLPRSPTSTLAPAPPARTPATPSAESVEAHRARELKWVSLMGSTKAADARKNKKVRRLLQEGVPASVRYQVWAHLTDSRSKRLDGLYSRLCARGRVGASEHIGRDVREIFERDSRLDPASLVNILQAYLTMVPDIQYEKGLTYIAGQLLLQSPEEDAFWIFISLMDTHLRPYFAANGVQLEVDAALFAKAVDAADPSVGKRLFVDYSIPAVEVVRPWFTSLFVEALPVDYFRRVWDIFLSDGVAFLFRVGLALLTLCRRTLLDTKGDEAVLALLRRPPQILISSTPEALIELAFSVKLKDDDVRKQRVKMEAQVKRQAQSRLALPSSTRSNSSTPSISLPSRP